jgi:hypothetical protein
MNPIKRLLSITLLFIFSVPAFSGVPLAENKVTDILTQKTKPAYYYHIGVHDNGPTGFVKNGYPQHAYDVYTFITNSKKADLAQGVIIKENLTSNINISISSDGSTGNTTITKQYVINAGSGYSVDTSNSGANLKVTISSISLSSYLYNGATIHLDYTVHYF